MNEAQVSGGRNLGVREPCWERARWVYFLSINLWGPVTPIPVLFPHKLLPNHKALSGPTDVDVDVGTLVITVSFSPFLNRVLGANVIPTLVTRHSDPGLSMRQVSTQHLSVQVCPMPSGLAQQESRKVACCSQLGASPRSRWVAPSVTEFDQSAITRDHDIHWGLAFIALWLGQCDTHL